MWKFSRNIVLFCLSFLLFLPVASCTSSSETSDQTVQVQSSDWNKLQSNNKELSNNLTKLEIELQKAKLLIRTSKLTLTEAQNELIQSKLQIIELQKELKEQKELSQRLSQQLNQLTITSKNATDSLTTTNKYLQDTINSINEDLDKQRKAEQKLRDQRTLWQIVAIGVGIYAAAK